MENELFINIWYTNKTVITIPVNLCDYKSDKAFYKRLNSFVKNLNKDAFGVNLIDASKYFICDTVYVASKDIITITLDNSQYLDIDCDCDDGECCCDCDVSYYEELILEKLDSINETITKLVKDTKSDKDTVKITKQKSSKKRGE